MTDKSENSSECENSLEDYKAKIQEYLDLAKRIQADFDNYRKRTVKENEEFRKFATADLMIDLLNINDDLERALSHDEVSVEGIKMIHANLTKLLQSRGIKEIDASGKFDPNVHEALCMCEGENDNEIKEIFQKGYRMDDRVLRYSKVKVTKTKQKEEGD